MNHCSSTLCYTKDISLLYNQSKTATNWVHCDTHKQNFLSQWFYHFHFNSIILIFMIDSIPCAVTFENFKLYKGITTERVTLEEISTRETLQCKILNKWKGSVETWILHVLRHVEVVSSRLGRGKTEEVVRCVSSRARSKGQ